MDRDARIADLVIHGWEPTKSNGKVGVYNECLRMGFGVVVEPGYGIIVDGEMPTCVVGEVRRIFSSHPCPWSLVTDEILDKIEDRLRAT